MQSSPLILYHQRNKHQSMKLEKLLEEGYDLFSEYHLGASLDVCKYCCVSDEVENKLLRTPIKEIDIELMSEYLLSAQCYTLKEFNDMCYFLPRILELIAENKFPWYSEESIFNRLFYDKKFLGTDRELDFLQRFFLEYWINYLNKQDLDIDVTSLLAMMLGNGGIAFKPFLTKWDQIKSYSATYLFAEFMLSYDRASYVLNFIGKTDVDDDLRAWLLNDQIYKHFTDRLIASYFDEKCLDEDKLYIESALIIYEHFRKIF